MLRTFRELRTLSQYRAAVSRRQAAGGRGIACRPSSNRPPHAPSRASPVIRQCRHGLRDPFLLAGALDRTWEWVAQPLTLVTIPGAAHFVQWDASAVVTTTIERWLVDARAAK
jgi:hypothetical protein